MTDTSRIRVVIDAGLVSGQAGGIEQVIIGLAHGMSGLDGDDEYLFLCRQGHTDWLEPYVGGQSRIVTTEVPIRRRIAQALPGVAALRRRVKSTIAPAEGPPPVPASNGTVERLAADVVHFPMQSGFLTAIPSVYHPHDLQHIHFPEFFTVAERMRRDHWYRTLSGQASVVAVTSEWGKTDLVENLGVDAEKIAVVPLAPALAAYDSTHEQPDATEWLVTHGIERPFVLYPAQTWPHKNHARLIRAIALLRDQGVSVNLVCTGKQNEHFAEVSRSVRELGLQDRVHFPGYVSADELRMLYETASGLIMPTLFEAAGGFGPIAEAFLAGLPVACSNVTSLPMQVGDAALVFDPLDEAQIALALRRLWTEPELREQLRARGAANVARFSWDRTARTFRAHYRRLAGRTLCDDDVMRIEATPDF